MNCTIRLLGDVNLSSPTATVVATAAAAYYSLSALPLYLFIVVLIAVGFTLVNGYRMSSRPSDPPLPPQASMFAAFDCAICLGQFAVGDEIRELPPCRHAYHVDCIDIWLGSHSFCPYCRQILVVDGGFPANKREYRMINVFLP